MKTLPVIKVTFKEFNDAREGHPTKRIKNAIRRLKSSTFRYEITDIPAERTKTDLYFILHGNFVKIGQSTNPQKRLEEFQVGAPETLKILATIPKKGEIEFFCHKKFKHLHHRGEWFHYTSEIDLFIEELKILL